MIWLVIYQNGVQEEVRARTWVEFVDILNEHIVRLGLPDLIYFTGKW